MNRRDFITGALVAPIVASVGFRAGEVLAADTIELSHFYGFLDVMAGQTITIIRSDGSEEKARISSIDSATAMTVTLY